MIRKVIDSNSKPGIRCQEGNGNEVIYLVPDYQWSVIQQGDLIDIGNHI